MAKAVRGDPENDAAAIRMADNLVRFIRDCGRQLDERTLYSVSSSLKQADGMLEPLKYARRKQSTALPGGTRRRSRKP